MSKLEINDEGLASWLWDNSQKVAQIEQILSRRRSKEYTIKAIKRVLTPPTPTEGEEVDHNSLSELEKLWVQGQEGFDIPQPQLRYVLQLVFERGNLAALREG